MIVGKTSYTIGNLLRTIEINLLSPIETTFVSGKADLKLKRVIHAVAIDEINGRVKPIFHVRNFHTTKNYPTIEGNVERAMRYYHAPQSAINFMLDCLTNKIKIMAKKSSNKVKLVGYIKPWGGAQGEISEVAWSTFDSPEEARKEGVSKVQCHQWCKFEIKLIF